MKANNQRPCTRRDTRSDFLVRHTEGRLTSCAYYTHTNFDAATVRQATFHYRCDNGHAICTAAGCRVDIDTQLTLTERDVKLSSLLHYGASSHPRCKRRNHSTIMGAHI